MARGRKTGGARNGTGANLGFEATLWLAADKLRSNMDAAEYKHVVLGLIFLKYISDAFEERRVAIEVSSGDPKSEWFVKDPAARFEALEDRDMYASENVFWVPKEARWPSLLAGAKRPEIGRLLDEAMTAIERENPSLKGVLPKDYARPALDKQRLGELMDLIGSICFQPSPGPSDHPLPAGEGSQQGALPSPRGRGVGGEGCRKAIDVLGRVYEYFLARFASAEGKSGGQFYTPRCVVQVLVEMLAPYKGRVFDPCCGSGGMFVQSEKFVEAHGGGRGDISVYGQESNQTTWRLAKMNLALRGIEAHIAWNHEGSFHNDAHKDLRADFVIANPPFNDSDWGGERLREDPRWKYGVAPAGNANYAWVQHFIHHLCPTGTAGFVLANGSMSSNQSGEGEIRKAIVEADLVDCMVAMPGQLFYSTQIPVCLWFIAKDKSGGTGARYGKRLRDRRGQVLFLDARKLGTLVDRVHRELNEEDIAKIAGTYHAWRGDIEPPPAEKAAIKAPPFEKGGPGGIYQDIPGFCKSATLEEIRAHGHVLTPGRYVGAEAQEDDGEPFDEKMKRLTAQLEEQFAEGSKLDEQIRENLSKLGFRGP